MAERISRSFIPGERMVRALRGFDRLVSGFVDIDVAPQSSLEPMTYANSKEFVADMADILKNCSNRCSEYTLAKGVSALYFARALGGERLDIFSYSSQVNGFRPSAIREDVLRQQRGSVEGLLRSNGLSYTSEGWNRLFHDQILDRNGITDIYREVERSFLPKLLDLGGVKLQPKLRIAFVENDEGTWTNWFSADPEDKSGYLLQVNMHNDNKVRLFKGNVENLAYHELTHQAQIVAWKQGVGEGKLDPICGVMTVPGPEQWGSEGLAVAIPKLMKKDVYDNLSLQGKIAAELQVLASCVYQNVHIWINTGAMSPEQARKYVLKYLPYEDDKRIAIGLDKRTNDPRNRAYLLTYGAGGYIQTRFAVDMEPDSVEQLIVSQLRSPLTARQIEHKAVNLRYGRG